MESQKSLIEWYVSKIYTFGGESLLLYIHNRKISICSSFCLVSSHFFKCVFAVRGVFKGTKGAQPLSWTSEIHSFLGVFWLQRVLSPSERKKKIKPLSPTQWGILGGHGGWLVFVTILLLKCICLVFHS